jgi:hypothetical protein
MSLIVTSNLTEVEMDSRGLHFRARQLNLSLSLEYRGLIRRSLMIGDNIGIYHVTGRSLGRLPLLCTCVDYVTRHVLNSKSHLTTKIIQRIPVYAANFVPANDMILDLLPRAMSQTALAVLKPLDGALSSAAELRGSLSGDPIGI